MKLCVGAVAACGASVPGVVLARKSAGEFGGLRLCDASSWRRVLNGERTALRVLDASGVEALHPVRGAAGEVQGAVLGSGGIRWPLSVPQMYRELDALGNSDGMKCAGCWGSAGRPRTMAASPPFLPTRPCSYGVCGVDAIQVFARAGPHSPPVGRARPPRSWL